MAARQVVLVPGKTANTRNPTITIAPMKPGKYTFSVTVKDDAGLVGQAEFKVTVRQR